ncbi:MAG: CoB--CoM heterodisulfide reductase iron-sulfur subunit A family protein [Acidobacteria bacterium]|jgi:heterodisulfide reductase subunit A|nr:CoB--CoM heterodisulfide reductase iron-sulfur subunit A family protein [Acidobacteriota bacterium]
MMSIQLKTGVYIYQNGKEGVGPTTIDYQAVADYAKGLPQVDRVTLFNEPKKLNPLALADEFKKAGLSRIVIAGESPGYFKPAFTRAMAEAGGDPDEVRIASFREHGVGLEGPTDRAKAVVACAVFGVPFGLAAIPANVPVNPSTMVIGGGVAGIQAALEIADAGYKVYLVENLGTIGGHMAMFDKTFPTLDCAACILTPKMVAVGQHPNIELMVLSEVQDVTGRPGAYQVKILKKTGRVDPKACVACNACAEVCPVSVPSEFDVGIANRKAIYIPFPQAVPNTYIIDGASCTYIQSEGKKCGACMKKCAKDAIHFDAKDEIIEFEVGNIIVATGYDTFDAHKLERYGYGALPNVLTSLEFERLTNASGPTGGKIVAKTKKLNKRTKTEEWVFDTDGPKPQSVAIIHCVGSRDQNFNPYCSRVCCMYSLKFGHLVREKLPEATCYEYYIDMRAFGKGYEEFFERIKEEGVHVVRGRSARIIPKGDRMIVKGEDIIKETVIELPVDMVLLAVGLQPTKDAERLAAMLGIERVQDGWFSELEYNVEPTSTERGGIFVAGVCQGPKDIPDTVAQASAVAAKVLKSIVSGSIQGSRHRLTLLDIEQKAMSLAN